MPFSLVQNWLIYSSVTLSSVSLLKLSYMNGSFREIFFLGGGGGVDSIKSAYV